MSSLYRIKEQMKDYTNTEQKIAEYIMENRDTVIQSSVHDIAKAIDVSPAALVRFSKKTGFKGFSHLKVALAQDNHSSHTRISDFIIDGKESLPELVEKARLANLNTFDLTYKLVNQEHLEAAIEHLVRARRIYLVGVGASHLVAKDFYQKLTRIDRDVRLFEDVDLLIASIANITPEDVAIIFSYSGNTRSVLLASDIAREKGAYVVGISHLGNNALSRDCDVMLTVPREENDLRLGSISSRYSMLILGDLMYYGIVHSQFDASVEKLVNTRKQIVRLNDKK